MNRRNFLRLCIGAAVASTTIARVLSPKRLLMPYLYEPTPYIGALKWIPYPENPTKLSYEEICKIPNPNWVRPETVPGYAYSVTKAYSPTNT